MLIKCRKYLSLLIAIFCTLPSHEHLKLRSTNIECLPKTNEQNLVVERFYIFRACLCVLIFTPFNIDFLTLKYTTYNNTYKKWMLNIVRISVQPPPYTHTIISKPISSGCTAQEQPVAERRYLTLREGTGNCSTGANSGGWVVQEWQAAERSYLTSKVRSGSCEDIPHVQGNK